MRIRLACLTGLLALVCETTAADEISAALRDAAARIDYGWYTGDSRLIRAARDSLDASSREPWGNYLRAYAAYRASQLLLDRGAAAGDELANCIAAAEAIGGDATVAAEASVLVVACSAMAASAEPLRAVWHQRRQRQGLEQAQALAPGNPRLALVRHRHLGDPAVSLDAVVAAFGSGRSASAFPDWGEADALLLQSEQRLAAGNLRGARDALDEVLLLAPDFEAALELKARVGALTAAN